MARLSEPGDDPDNAAERWTGISLLQLKFRVRDAIDAGHQRLIDITGISQRFCHLGQQRNGHR
jgi:hypothetical protein